MNLGFLLFFLCAVFCLSFFLQDVTCQCPTHIWEGVHTAELGLAINRPYFRFLFIGLSARIEWRVVNIGIVSSRDGLGARFCI